MNKPSLIPVSIILAIAGLALIALNLARTDPAEASPTIHIIWR